MFDTQPSTMDKREKKKFSPTTAATVFNFFTKIFSKLDEPTMFKKAIAEKVQSFLKYQKIRQSLSKKIQSFRFFRV